MSNYEITLWWSEADSVFVAEVPELPGCSAHGVTQEEALANVREAMALWIDVARSAGEVIPEPKARRAVRA